MNRLRAAGLAGLLAITVAACSSSPDASATPSPTATPEATPTPVATTGPGTSGIPFPSLGNADAELEALIPASVDGIMLQTYSMKGNQFMGSDQADPQSQAFLSALGVSPSDISVAFGFGVDINTQSALGVFAFKAPGAGADSLLSVFQTASGQSDAGYKWSSATVGGKSVQQSDEPSTPGVKIYLYATNDILFLVTGNEQPAADALSTLP